MARFLSAAAKDELLPEDVWPGLRDATPTVAGGFDGGRFGGLGPVMLIGGGTILGIDDVGIGLDDKTGRERHILYSEHLISTDGVSF